MRRVLALSLLSSILLLLAGCRGSAPDLPVFGGSQLNQQRRAVDEYFTAHAGKALHLTLQLTDLTAVDRDKQSEVKVTLYGADKKPMAQFSASNFVQKYCWLVPATGVYHLQFQTAQQDASVAQPLVKWAIGESNVMKANTGQMEDQNLGEVVYFNTQFRPYNYYRHSRFYKIFASQQQKWEAQVTSDQMIADQLNAEGLPVTTKTIFKPQIELFDPDGRLVYEAHPECKKPQTSTIEWKPEKTGNYLLIVTGYLDRICPEESSQFVGARAYGQEMAPFHLDLTMEE